MTIVNNNYFRYSVSSNDKFINIPVEIKFDNAGREDGIIEFETDVLSEIINGINDFETTRFANAPYVTQPSVTEINYEIYFFDPTLSVTATTTTSSAWSTTYQNQGFFDNEIYYFANSFKQSFFKLDFYDTNTNENQRAYFTVILPTQQGQTMNGQIGPTQVQIKKPVFTLDYLGADKEGFFIYWLKERDYININEFYMTAKFYNGKTGQFIRLMNEPQSTLSGPDKFNFNKSEYFYYKVVLNYTNYEYEMYKMIPQVGSPPVPQRVGDSANPIKWYEYVNP
jgi:hypothetical protein